MNISSFVGIFVWAVYPIIYGNLCEDDVLRIDQFTIGFGCNLFNDDELVCFMNMWTYFNRKELNQNKVISASNIEMDIVFRNQVSNVTFKESAIGGDILGANKWDKIGINHGEKQRYKVCAMGSNIKTVASHDDHDQVVVTSFIHVFNGTNGESQPNKSAHIGVNTIYIFEMTHEEFTCTYPPLIRHNKNNTCKATCGKLLSINQPQSETIQIITCETISDP